MEMDKFLMEEKEKGKEDLLLCVCGRTIELTVIIVYLFITH